MLTQWQDTITATEKAIRESRTTLSSLSGLEAKTQQRSLFLHELCLASTKNNVHITAWDALREAQRDAEECSEQPRRRVARGWLAECIRRLENPSEEADSESERLFAETSHEVLATIVLMHKRWFLDRHSLPSAEEIVEMFAQSDPRERHTDDFGPLLRQAAGIHDSMDRSVRDMLKSLEDLAKRAQPSDFADITGAVEDESYSSSDNDEFMVGSNFNTDHEPSTHEPELYHKDDTRDPVSTIERTDSPRDISLDSINTSHLKAKSVPQLAHMDDEVHVIQLPVNGLMTSQLEEQSAEHEASGESTISMCSSTIYNDEIKLDSTRAHAEKKLHQDWGDVNFQITGQLLSQSPVQTDQRPTVYSTDESNVVSYPEPSSPLSESYDDDLEFSMNNLTSSTNLNIFAERSTPAPEHELAEPSIESGVDPTIDEELDDSGMALLGSSQSEKNNHVSESCEGETSRTDGSIISLAALPTTHQDQVEEPSMLDITDTDDRMQGVLNTAEYRPPSRTGSRRASTTFSRKSEATILIDSTSSATKRMPIRDTDFISDNEDDNDELSQAFDRRLSELIQSASASARSSRSRELHTPDPSTNSRRCSQSSSSFSTKSHRSKSRLPPHLASARKAARRRTLDPFSAIPTQEERELLSQREFPLLDIVDEKIRDGERKYYIHWEPINGREFKNTWEPVAYANAEAVAEWERKKLKRKRRQSGGRGGGEESSVMAAQKATIKENKEKLEKRRDKKNKKPAVRERRRVQRKRGREEEDGVASSQDTKQGRRAKGKEKDFGLA
jgi:hypothetical protein